MAGPIIAEFTSFLQGDRGNYNGAYLPPKRLGCPTSTLIDVLTNSAHPKNAKDDHSKMLTELELMMAQPLGGYQLPVLRQLLRPPASPVGQRRTPPFPPTIPADFRRKATFEEAISFLAPPWHR